MLKRKAKVTPKKKVTPKTIPDTPIRTTDAEIKTIEPSRKPAEMEEKHPVPVMEKKKDSKIPDYRDGCPECGEFPLVTMAKYEEYRFCRCRNCSWQGKMTRR